MEGVTRVGRIEEIEKRLWKATPSPWDINPQGGVQVDGTSDGYDIEHPLIRRIAVLRNDVPVDRKQTLNNALFIAQAPEDIHFLLKEVKQLQDSLDWYGIYGRV